MTQQRSYEVIVVGLGAMGSATLFHLARRGVRVVGLEQFGAGHALGSSHGDSRIIRETYFEHPLYVPLVRRAHELWRELERVSGTTLMKIAGGLMIGPRDGMVVTGTLRSAREHGLPHETLTASAVGERFPAFRVRVETRNGNYLADRLVLAGGAWIPRLARSLVLPLTVERQSVFWLDPGASSEAYKPDRFPIYAYEFKPGTICYGFPRLPRGVKASVMHDGAIVSDPDKVNRGIGDEEVEPLRSALRPILPELAESRVCETGVCLFTNTPDHDFIIDFHPEYPQVLVSSPCSGHGFKFASAIGEAQADLLTQGKSRFDLTPFRIGRWRDTRDPFAAMPSGG